jgi:hypothetical protein
LQKGHKKLKVIGYSSFRKQNLFVGILSHLLQKTESRFIIETAVAEFIRQYGARNEFVSTIHDSIVVKASMLEEAESTMRFCFGMEGLYPKFEAKMF